jgi:hypothetical protein
MVSAIGCGTWLGGHCADAMSGAKLEGVSVDTKDVDTDCFGSLSSLVIDVPQKNICYLGVGESGKHERSRENEHHLPSMYASEGVFV